MWVGEHPESMPKNAMLKSPPPLLAIALCALVAGIGWFVMTTPTLSDQRAYFSQEILGTIVKCPGDAPDGRPAADDLRAEWYAKVWRAADEPSLYLQSRDAKPPLRRTYRFTWLRTFHAPVVVRLDERDGGRFWMTAKRLSGKGGYDPGQVTGKTERFLTPDETRAILGLLDRAKTVAPTSCDMGLDGSQWILEGVEGGKLSYADRWSPKAGPVHKVGLAFLGLTGWKLDPVY
jgi:hypothetical protein